MPMPDLTPLLPENAPNGDPNSADRFRPTQSNIDAAAAWANTRGFSGLFGKGFLGAMQQKAIGDRASNNLRADAVRLNAERTAMQPFKARDIGGAGNAASRLRKQLGRDATMRVAQADQAAPFSFRGALDQATRRMRARQGIVNRGDKAVGNQALKDRIEIARQNAVRRGTSHNALQQAANIREGVNAGVMDANQLVAQSRASMFGSIAGGVLRVGQAYASRSQPWNFGGTDPLAEGTGMADFYNSQPPTNYSDPVTTQPTVLG